MNIKTELRPLDKMNPMQRGQGKQPPKDEKPMAAPKTDSFTPKAQSLALAPEVEASNNTAPSISVEKPLGETSASSFSDPKDYLNYLKDTYPSISNSNISISEKALMQAMTDPEKEKILTDFLDEMDGAADYRAGEVAGMNDGTYKYEMEHYSVRIDAIGEEDVIGSDFTVLTVQREDGQAMSKGEFGDVKKDVIEYFKELTGNEQIKVDIWKNMLDRQVEIREKTLERQEENRKADKAEEAKEQRDAKLSPEIQKLVDLLPDPEELAPKKGMQFFGIG